MTALPEKREKRVDEEMGLKGGTWPTPKLTDLLMSVDDRLEYIGDVLSDIKDILKMLTQTVMSKR